MSESYDVYRGLYPSLTHQEFVQLRSIRNASIPGAPTQQPLATDDSLPDSQKARYELVYLVEILKSWEQVHPQFQDRVSVGRLCGLPIPSVEQGEVEYDHDGLTHQSLYRFGVKSRSRGRRHFYFQIPLSNNGYLYRIVDPDLVRTVALHGAAHPGGIDGYLPLTEVGSESLAEFADFGVTWFGCSIDLLRLSVFYNGEKSRLDIRVERLDFPAKKDKVSLEFCFEPGFPIKEFDEFSFAITQDFLDKAPKRKRQRTTK
jgi:hypothetical protein